MRFTRDDVKLTVGMIVAVVVGIVSLGDAATTYGIPAACLPYLRLAALVLGIVSGKLATSPLPGDNSKIDTSRFLIWLLPLVLLGGLSVSACAPPPPNLNPAATVAYNQSRLEKALDVIRDTAKDGCEIPTPPVVACADAFTIVKWHKAAINIIEAQNTGWQTQVATTLDQVTANLPPATRTLLAPYVALVKTVLLEAFPS